MLRFMDKVKVKAKHTLLQLVNQQTEQFFDGHTGFVCGQKANLNYVVCFHAKLDIPESLKAEFPEASLEFLGNDVPPSQVGFIPDVMKAEKTE